MSTNATITDPNTQAALPIKKENVSFAVVFKVDTAGVPVRDEKGNVLPPRHTSSENDIRTLKGFDKDGKPLPEGYKGNEMIAFEQTVSRPVAGTIEGFLELIKDKDEALNIINKGLASKFNQKIRTKLIEQNEDGSLVFQPTDTVFDATELVQEAAQRVSLSPEDKVRKMIAASGLSPEALAAIVAQFQAISAGQTATAE